MLRVHSSSTSPEGWRRTRWFMAGACIVLCGAGGEQEQSVLPGAPEAALIEELRVTGRRAQPLETARHRAEATPGGVSLVTAQAISTTANVTLADALSAAPGVVIQSFFGANDQPRVQIRGSGLQQNPVERGVLVLQDGLPLNGADGAYIVGLIDPRQAALVEVFRGYTANRLGSTAARLRSQLRVADGSRVCRTAPARGGGRIRPRLCFGRRRPDRLRPGRPGLPQPYRTRRVSRPQRVEADERVDRRQLSLGRWPDATSAGRAR